MRTGVHYIQERIAEMSGFYFQFSARSRDTTGQQRLRTRNTEVENQAQKLRVFPL